MTTELGHLVPEHEYRRDAVHVAIAPVTALERLEPGQHVGLDGSSSHPHVGVVDPFLTSPVEVGQRFWLCMYPNTVTGIRHIWTMAK